MSVALMRAMYKQSPSAWIVSVSVESGNRFVRTGCRLHGIVIVAWSVTGMLEESVAPLGKGGLGSPAIFLTISSLHRIFPRKKPPFSLTGMTLTIGDLGGAVLPASGLLFLC